MKTCLYRIVHIESGRDYVGISCEPSKRWASHIRDAKIGKGYHFANALRKYGKGAFSWNIVAWTSCFEGAQTLEKLARTLGFGDYNITMGGEGMLGWKPSVETKARISEAKKGVRKNDEQLATCRAAMAKMTSSPEHKAHLERLHASPQGVAKLLSWQASPDGKAHLQSFKSARKGIPMSDTTKAKIKATIKARKVGFRVKT